MALTKPKISAQVPLLFAALAASVVISLCSGSHAAAAVGTPPGGFCGAEPVVRDYLAPLARFQEAKGFPESGRLRVGPKALRVYPPREQLIAIGRDRFEAQGALSQPPPRPPAPLGWRVSSRLERIGKKGSASKTVMVKRQYVATVNQFRFRNFGFGSNVSPGIYRLEVRFELRSGELLDEYQEYFRAVRARSRLRLAADRTALSPSAGGFLRVENYGTVGATYFSQYRIWHTGEASSELLLPTQNFSGSRPLVKAGHAGECIKFSVPPDTPAGEYQVGVEARDALLSKRTLLLTPFRVEIQSSN